ncbi:hypothetical protein Tco_1523712 [Tanacetum coccineum]
MGEPLRLGYGALRHHRVSAFRQPTLTTWVDPEDGRVYTDIPVYVPPVSPVQTPPSPEWSSDSLPISPSSPVVASPLELHGSIIHDHTQRLDALPPTLFADIDKDVRELYTRPVLALEAWAGRIDTRLADISWDRYDDHRLIQDMLVQQAAMQRELQEMRGRVTALNRRRIVESSRMCRD